MFYSVVTFGLPSVRRLRFSRSIEAAKTNAHACKGTGTCSSAQVIASTTRALAKEADISRTLPGQELVYSV